MSKARRAAAFWLSAALFASSALGCGKGASASATTGSAGPGAVPIATTTPLPALPTVPPPALLSGDGMPVSFAPLARRADPAVATVKSRVERSTNSGRRRVVAEGLGTAFVYDPDGYLLTNNHVIEDATDVMVSFFDGGEFKGTVVGRDKHTDIAVLKIDKTGLPSVPLGDSDAIDVGDWVVAIGNPFGLSHTVSAGILSGKGRTRDDVKGLDPSGYFNFLQTDASINPGNSGGPLLNARGEVVGINSAVRANANSIGFAIPINMVKQLLPTLLRDGKLRRSAIGVEVDPLNATDATRLHRPDHKGAWVTRVLAGGPAERAGLATDDVIVAFDGKPIEGPNELRWLASIAGVNKVATVRVARSERTFDLRVTLGELADQGDADDDH
ncbi:MAG: trypsin-like peptidase domain-containing protein [Byssovorax sp.]